MSRTKNPTGFPAGLLVYLYLSVRDGGIELPTTVWKTVVLPLN